MTPFLTLTLDRPSHRYWIGEKAVYRFLAQDDCEADADFTIGGQTKLLHRTLQLKGGVPQEIELGLPSPGFLRCEVLPRGKNPLSGTMRAAAAFEPENIRPQLPMREDFEDFWKNALSELHGLPDDFKMEEAPSMSLPGFAFYRVSAANVNGTRAYGWLSVPKAVFGPVPLLITVSGCGPGFNATSMWPRREFLGVWKDPVCVLCLAVHDFEPPDDASELKKKYAAMMEAHKGVHSYLHGIEHPESCSLRRAILGCVRLTELVSELKFVDPSCIVWAGAGQGGDFGIYVSALTKKITAAFIGTPGFCDLGDASNKRHSVMGQLPEFREHLEEQRLFDCIWHARNVRNPILLSVDYADTTSLPGAVFPILHTLQGERLVLELVGGGLGFGDKSSMHTVRAWLRCNLKLI